MTVTWLGLHADYTETERDLMSTFPHREQVLIHALKALTNGEISGTPRGEPSQSRDAVPEKVPTLYTDPEDIPFGEDIADTKGDNDGHKPRKRPIYALVWTFRKHRIVKTKKRATQVQRVWKNWYLRQGWSVTNHPDGYFARSPAGELHVIALHEYDAASRARLN